MRVRTSGSLRTMEFRAKNLCMNTIAVPGTLAGLRKMWQHEHGSSLSHKTLHQLQAR